MELPVSESLIAEKVYLDGELISGIKHEYVAGQVYAMSGGSLNHQTVATNFLCQAGNQLVGKPCRPTNSDFKVRVKLGEDCAFYYPDATIICTPLAGDAQFTDDPTVILEVISPSTRRIDEVQKFRDYITIPSLQVYLLAESDLARVTVFRRVGESFVREVIGGIDAVLDLSEVSLSIPFAELYRDVELKG
ncbi:Uma2 family endonuclease [Haloferula chungangensis]|uniref:Uma2 family endonuclease n=1 Tax=Haloferula chungangensis TaxID=1048331 RepID=A0ABW2L4R4_9BACT